TSYIHFPLLIIFFFSSRRRHTRSLRDWSSDVCSSDLASKMVMLKGIGVSAGVAQGTAYVVAEGLRSTVPNRSVRASELEGERARFDAAVARADAELLALQEEVRENIGPSQADIFAAQRLVLGDPFLREQALRSAAEQRINVEAALSKVFDEYTRRLETAPDGNLRARTADIHDVRRR